ncbi:acyl-CoA hydrolase [Ligilactobacillus sp. WC1T17]|uniref:Acyl-CoA hydrolase n=1 Tax=Ligilactobacillus ruminis TaxID=1623 RepID=A0ABY1A926_9LACO|nr:acyl-CoA hydrolase [Ligilactobacillus ruminis]
MITCQQTKTISEHRVINGDLNEHETFYGGRLLAILDGVASIPATKLARCQVVTASVDRVNFLQPFALNDALKIECYVSGVGNRSIEVFAKVIGEHLLTGQRFLGATAFLTFVVLDHERILPAVTPQTAEEKAVCQGFAQRRLQNKQKLELQKELLTQLDI